MIKHWRFSLAVLLCAVSLLASALDKPTGRVVLSISGNVGKANAGKDVQFDMPMLEALPQHSFSTQTPWFPEAVKFTGPRLRDVLAAAGAKGSKVVAVAINDYKAELPFSDAAKYDVILAVRKNDKLMGVRDKGPLFLIYPFDSQSELKTETYYGRSTWQLKALVIN